MVFKFNWETYLIYFITYYTLICALSLKKKYISTNDPLAFRDF